MATKNRSDLVRVSLELLDEHGIDGLSMRVLAQRLGLQAASLYNHVADMNELLALIADALCESIVSPELSKPWRGELERLATQYRRALLSRRDAARVLAATPLSGANRTRLVEGLVACIRAAGVTPAKVADWAAVMNSFLVGFVLDETAKPPSPVNARRFKLGVAALLDGLERQKTVPG